MLTCSVPITSKVSDSACKWSNRLPHTAKLSLSERISKACHDVDDCAAASLQVAMFCCQLELWLCLLLRFRGMSGHHTCVFLQMLQ